MKCPLCKQSTHVEDTAPIRELTTRRVRLCPSGHRFTTYELFIDYLLPDVEKVQRRFVKPEDREVVQANLSVPAADMAQRLGLSTSAIYKLRMK